MSTTSQVQLTGDLEDWSQPQLAAEFKLPEMHDASVDDNLNRAFLNEPSEIVPATDVFNVKSQLAELQVEQNNFSITQMLAKHTPRLGRRTENTSRPFEPSSPRDSQQ